MDSLYEAVQSSGDGPPPPIPSRSSSRACSRSASRSCSPAVLLDDHTNWPGSGRSISMVRRWSRGKDQGQIVSGHFAGELGLLEQADCNCKIKLIMKCRTKPVDRCSF